MAFATKVTIGTGNKITQSYQSQDVSVSVSYDLERADTDLVAFMAEKAVEVEACHTAVWQGIYGIRAERASAGADAPAANDAASAGPPYQQNQTRRTRKNKELEAPASDQSPAAPEAPAQAAPQEPAQDAGQTPAEAPAEPSPTADVRAYEPATNLQKIVIRSLWTRAGHTPADMSQLTGNLYGKATLDDLTKPEAAELTLALQKGEIGQPQAAAA